MRTPYRPLKEYNIPKMFEVIRKAIKPYPKAMLFELRDRGHRSLFEQLVSCILSIRSLDEVSLIAAENLIAKAPTPEKILELPLDELAELIKPCTFYYQKAKTLQQISDIALTQYKGELPSDFESLIALPGVGPKCAGLALGIAAGQARIGVDVHVHRITNRWGYVSAKTPEKTMLALEKILPKSRWVEINELLVPFGKHICRGTLPKCTTCPVLSYCRQIGVTKYV
jgi:endonuclease-3